MDATTRTSLRGLLAEQNPAEIAQAIAPLVNALDREAIELLLASVDAGARARIEEVACNTAQTSADAEHMRQLAAWRRDYLDRQRREVGLAR